MARSTSLHYEIMKYYPVRRFDGGLNDQYSRNLLADNQAEDILNFDLTTRGSIKVRLGSVALHVSALTFLSAVLSAHPIFGPSAFYLSGGTAYVSATGVWTLSAVVSAASATYAPSAFVSIPPLSAYLSAGAIWPSGAGSTLSVIDTTARRIYLRVGPTSPIRGLTRYYNTSSTNQWVAFCSGRIHFGGSVLSSYLAQTFTVDSDMDFVTFKDTLLFYNGNEKYKSKLRSKTDSSSWAAAPVMDILKPWQDRLWCVPTASAYAVRFTSAIGSTEAWSAADYFIVGRQDGGNIVGLEVFQGSLIILKTTGIYVMVGTHPDNYQLEQMTDKGCVAKGSIVVGDTGIIYLSSDGVRLFDGITSHMLSETEDYWLNIVGVMNTARLSRIRAKYHDRKYILGYDDSGAGETLNNNAWVYNFRTNSWTKYSLRGNGMYKTLGADEDSDLYIGSSVSGIVFRLFSGTTDYASGPAAMSAAISALYKTKAFDMSDQRRDRINEEKQFLKVSVQGSMDAGSIRMNSQVDSGDGPAQADILEYEGSGGFLLDTDVLDVGVLGSGSNRFSHEHDMDVGMAGKTMTLELTARDLAQSAEIDAIVIGYRDKGQRG